MLDFCVCAGDVFAHFAVAIGRRIVYNEENDRGDSVTEAGELQKILSRVRRAVDNYHMIEDGDRIAVGVSGGKDSLTLLCALHALGRFYPKSFSLVPIFLDTALPGFDPSPIASLCGELGLPLVTVQTDIYKIVFEIRREKNPCSLCAMLRRGALHDAALANDCRKVALGHHFDDAVETLLLNLFNEGRFGCFSPVSYLDRKGVTLIRPLLYTEEKEIRAFVRRAGIATVGKNCPADGHTDRERIKTPLAGLEREDRGLRRRLFGAMERAGLDGYRVCPRSRRGRQQEGKDDEP